MVKRIFSLILLGLFSIVLMFGCGNVKRVPDTRKLSDAEFSVYNLTGTDALGRRLSVAGKPKKQTKYVGLFYSLWEGQHPDLQKGIYDIQKLLDTNPDALNDSKGNKESPLFEFHYWGEPLYGYYSMSDPWILKRHMELLTNSGIDYLCIDATNAHIYNDPAFKLFHILQDLQKQGFKPPKIAFYTNTKSGSTVNEIYETYYKSGEYDSIWFAPEDRPLIIGITQDNGNASDQTKFGSFTDFIKPNMLRYFDVRESQWPNGNFNENSIPWMSWECPQQNHNGSVAVPVGQHSHSMIDVSAMSPECARAYNNITKRIESDWTAGASFQTMWDAVHESKQPVTNVLMTSWNEWMAQKLVNKDHVHFVDVYNHQYSRDMEMMKGGYNDNYYLQMMQNVRKFKLTEGEHFIEAQKTIDITAGGAQWKDVPSTYLDFAGDAVERNFANAAGTENYTDNSNRNDITKIKVTHDKKNLYFRIETKDDITPYNGSDLNWMNLFITTDPADKNSFAGYQYVINRTPNTDGTTSIERSQGGYAWESCGRAKIFYSFNVMQIQIPFSALHLSENEHSIDFKVSDHVTHYEDIMDYYVTGDSAPLGRLSYNYGY